jgi:hypothetical protein
MKRLGENYDCPLKCKCVSCSNVEKLFKYDRKQLILSHMYLPSEMCFKCRRCSMKNLFLKTHSLIEKCTKVISYLMNNVF